MDIANGYKAGLGEPVWEAGEGILDTLFGTPLPSYYELGPCLAHAYPPSSECGLALEQYLQKTGELKSVSKFILRLGKLPPECRMLMYEDLFPPLPEKGKYWVIEKRTLDLGHITDNNYLFCHVQGVVELFYQMSKCRTECGEMKNIAGMMIREMLEFLGRRMVLQLICNDSVDDSEQLFNLDVLNYSSTARKRIVAYMKQVPVFRLAKFSALTAHIKHLTIDIAVRDSHYIVPDVSERKSIRMVNAIALAMPNLKKVVLHLHVSKKDIKRGIKHPNQQAWVIACRILAARFLNREGKNLKIILTELDENIPSHVLDTWTKYGRGTEWPISEYETMQPGTPESMRHMKRTKRLEQAVTNLLREQLVHEELQMPSKNLSGDWGGKK